MKNKIMLVDFLVILAYTTYYLLRDVLHTPENIQLYISVLCLIYAVARGVVYCLIKSKKRNVCSVMIDSVKNTRYQG